MTTADSATTRNARCRPGLRQLTTAAGALTVVVGVLGVGARTFGVAWQPAIVLATFAPYTAVVGAVGSVLLGVRRQWWAAAVGLAVVVWTAVVQVPWFVADPPRPGVPLTVLQANLMVGAADADALVTRVRDGGVDLLTVEELTPVAATRLSAAGLDELLPFHLATPFPGGAGTGIWSTHPLTDTVEHDDFSFELLSATVEIPGLAPVRLFAVHLLPPWPYASSVWLDEVERLRALLSDAAREPGTVVAAGDYNATLDHRQFRSLLRHGFRDAAEQAGAGYVPTYPTERGLPPLVTLDHVLARDADATRARTVELPGSDHRGLLVTLSVRRAG